MLVSSIQIIPGCSAAVASCSPNPGTGCPGVWQETPCTLVRCAMQRIWNTGKTWQSKLGAQSEAPLSVPSADAGIGRHSHRREAFLTTVLPEQPVESFALLRTIPPCCRPLAAAAATV